MKPQPNFLRRAVRSALTFAAAFTAGAFLHPVLQDALSAAMTGAKRGWAQLKGQPLPASPTGERMGLKTYAKSVYDRSLANMAVDRAQLARTPGREFNARELAVLRKVFGDAVDYGAVTIKERPFKKETQQGAAFYNTISYPKGRPMGDEWLVHEVTHIWQAQQGKLKHSWDRMRQPSKYDTDFRSAIRAGKSWAKLSFEHQAYLIQEAFQSGYFDDPRVYDLEPAVKAVLQDAEAAFERSEEKLIQRGRLFEAVA
jgi:hypothetical protein